MIVPIDQLSAGMEVDRNVVNVNQALLVPQGTILTERHLRLLKMWGVHSVTVRGGKADGTTPATESPPNPELVAAAQEHVDWRFRHVKTGSTTADLIRQIALNRAIAAPERNATSAKIAES
jgi:hypothetical protein